MPPGSRYDDRLLQILVGIALLLFVGRAALPPGFRRRRWEKWARWGAVATFSAAVIYALAIILRWLLAPAR